MGDARQELKSIVARHERDDSPPRNASKMLQGGGGTPAVTSLQRCESSAQHNRLLPQRQRHLRAPLGCLGTTPAVKQDREEKMSRALLCHYCGWAISFISGVGCISYAPLAHSTPHSSLDCHRYGKLVCAAGRRGWRLQGHSPSRSSAAVTAAERIVPGLEATHGNAVLVQKQCYLRHGKSYPCKFFKWLGRGAPTLARQAGRQAACPARAQCSERTAPAVGSAVMAAEAQDGPVRPERAATLLRRNRNAPKLQQPVQQSQAAQQSVQQPVQQSQADQQSVQQPQGRDRTAMPGRCLGAPAAA
jgi:hypothetical protein